MGQPRGIRNNNPGNLRHSTDQWLGEVPGDDKAFKAFSDPFYGIRALAKLLLNYERKYGLRTISGIISRWAPDNENDTAAYIDAVAKACGVEPFQVLDVAAMLPSLVRAIIAHENGQQPYTDEQISQGIAMATGGDHAPSNQDADTALRQPPASILPLAGQGNASPQGLDVGGKVRAGLFPVPVSKKLTLAVLGLLAVILNQPLGLGLSDQQMSDLVKLVSAYVLGQAGVDAFAPVVKALVGGKS